MDTFIPLHQMYSQRENFVIVALTGITGSGCSAFADMMEEDFERWLEKGHIRPLSQIEDIPSANKQTEVFKREYRKCFNVSRHYEPFKIIKYKNVLIMYMLKDLFMKYTDNHELIAHLSDLLAYKFHHSYLVKEKKDYEVDNIFSEDTIIKWGLTAELTDKFRQIASLEKIAIKKEQKGDPASERETLRRLYADTFFMPAFENFCQNLYEDLKKRDYYSKNFFVHRLATAIRATGDSEKKYDDFKDSHQNDNVFELVGLINQIVKGYHDIDRNAHRRFVIDSVRNSLEILYLRERYNAFYMVAIHNDGHEKDLLREKVKKYDCTDRLDAICENIVRLSEIENKLDDFENGQFFSPDMSRCVSESELHIAFHTPDDLERTQSKAQKPENLEFTICSFFSYGEQWMKYAALIARPGLVTPTRDERCMSIAYVAKFSSGCISRQVGCTIVDQENAVQSVGWNDPPSPQLPCNLRDIDSLNEAKSVYDKADNKNDVSLYRHYSKFELSDSREYDKHDKEGKLTGTYGNGFCDCLNHECQTATHDKLSERGLDYAYCFRSRYNTYKENKDAVNTRSLHAEENTMLRLARQGGVGLNGGTMYVTASPCILCSKKAYQIGIKDIVYLDPYTDIAPDLILNCGYGIPRLRPFRGAIGGTFYKLYQPFLPYKDELKIWEEMTNGGKV